MHVEYGVDICKIPVDMRISPTFCLFAALAAAPSLAADWTYDEDYTGQEGWASISQAYSACESGQMQSPIQIGETSVKNMPPLKPESGKISGISRFVDHTLEFNVSSKNSLRIGGKIYYLETIRFHYPSEHMIRDVFYLAEARLAYRSAKGKALHIAVFLETGAENPALEAIFTSHSNATSVSFELQSLLPKSPGYYAYEGSLTYPPCTEGVQWIVYKHPIEIGAGQIETLVRMIGRNTRLPQPIYFRTIAETPF